VNVTDESIFLKAVFIVARLQRFGWNFNISNQYFLRLGDGVLDNVSKATMVAGKYRRTHSPPVQSQNGSPRRDFRFST